MSGSILKCISRGTLVLESDNRGSECLGNENSSEKYLEFKCFHFFVEKHIAAVSWLLIASCNYLLCYLSNTGNLPLF